MRNVARSVRHGASADVTERQVSGRIDPNLRDEVSCLLGAAGARWSAKLNVPQLRRELLEILRRLEND
jgi:hypothetical protein